MRILVPLLLCAAWPAPAQVVSLDPADGEAEEPRFDEDEDYEEEIVVTGRSEPRGSVIGDVEPEVTLGARDIRAYGASNLGELLEELAPLTGSIQGRGEGRPVVLLSGRRISGFREIRDLPPEAIARIDILPEEVALKYGYRADQKVVNFVLRRRFVAVTVEGETRQATAGGRQTYEADINYLRITPGSRLSIDAEYERANPLFENERDVAGADPDRTLLAASDAAKLNGTYNRTILGNVSATLNAELEGEDSRAALGRALDGSQRLLRDRRTRAGNINYALNGDLFGWRWSLDGGYTRDWSTSLTDRGRDGGVGRNRSHSVAESIETEATASGKLFELPAGAFATTLKTAFSLRDIGSEADRRGIITATELSRDQASAQANIDVPLFDDNAVGELTANGNGAIEQLSDFGTLITLGYGLNWEPIEEVRLIASMSHEGGAPSIQQLGNPILVTPNVRVFDVTTGQTVDVTRIEGGNPSLLADERRLIKLGLTVEPIEDTDLTLLANYTDTRIENPTASFPTATPEIEAAFPERFERGADGALLRIDSRPINFARSERRQLRWGFNWSETLEASAPVGASGRPLTATEIENRRNTRRAARGAGGEGGRRRDGRGFGGGGRQGRIQLGIFHEWRLENTLLIRPGVPALDLLNGSVTGGRGGEPRHQIELRAGYNRNGLGARLNIDWQSGTSVRANPDGASSPHDLTFGDLATVNLRLFADLGQQRGLVRAAPFLRGARVTLALNNLFDQRLDVRDAAGATPIGYQPHLIDPLGRSVRLSFRKLMF